MKYVYLFCSFIFFPIFILRYCGVSFFPFGISLISDFILLAALLFLAFIGTSKIGDGKKLNNNFVNRVETIYYITLCLTIILYVAGRISGITTLDFLENKLTRTFSDIIITIILIIVMAVNFMTLATSDDQRYRGDLEAEY